MLIFFQNRYMMGLGAFAFSMCVIYMVLWKLQTPDQQTHNALTDDETIVARKKRSHWD